MITKPTVLVLGAGASQPYRYPTGKELIQNIISNIEVNSSLVHRLLVFSGYNYTDLRTFKTFLSRSSQPSIDAFLERHQAFVDVGKLAITAALSEKENIDYLYDDRDNWYQHLFQAMDGTLIDDFKRNKLSVVTFNYDRSLDTFLFESLKHSHFIKDGSAAEAVLSIPIIHLHGQLGSLSWQNNEFYRAYGNNVDLNNLKKSSTSIKIIYETSFDKDENFIKAKKLIGEAEQIYFLGFGYHPDNLHRLGILGMNTDNKIIYGTAYGKTNREVTNIMETSSNKIDLRQPKAQYASILDFMRENISFS